MVCLKKGCTGCMVFEIMMDNYGRAFTLQSSSIRIKQQCYHGSGYIYIILVLGQHASLQLFIILSMRINPVKTFYALFHELLFTVINFSYSYYHIRCAYNRYVIATDFVDSIYIKKRGPGQNFLDVGRSCQKRWHLINFINIK